MVSQNVDERNFHIFYQLCSGADKNTRGMLHPDLIQSVVKWKFYLCYMLMIHPSFLLWEYLMIILGLFLIFLPKTYALTSE